MREVGLARAGCPGRCALLAALLALASSACLAGAAQREWREQFDEVQLTNEELQKLDTFEAHTIGKADKVFAGKDYRRAAAEYESFVLEFPRSKAIPYALVRKARCLHLGGKRYEAIKQYGEVLDYFANVPKYAAAALFFTGLCHSENGDEEKAAQAWAKMAEDKAYSQEPLAAWALTRLADHLAAAGRPDRAVAYHQQVATDFRRSNPQAASHAIEQVVRHYVRTKPDEPALRAFYQRVGGFGSNLPKAAGGNLEESRPYWGAVRMAIYKNGWFTDGEAELRTRYYSYWAGVLAGKFPEWDDYQIDVAHFQLMADRDSAKWVARLDAQFERYQKPEDFGRVLRWMRLFRGQRAKVTQYYGKLVFDKMTNAQIRELMTVFFDEVRDIAVAKNLFGKLRFDEMSEDDKVALARYLWQKDAALVEETCAHLTDKELGQMELLRYYHSVKDVAKGVPLATTLAGAPRFAKEALFKKAQLLQGAGKFAEAIQSYQQSDSPPESLWAIADCYAKTGKLDQAIAQLREVENFFKDHAADAAMRIARLYSEAGKDKLYVAALRSVLKKYPESPQSSEAHQALERMGIKAGGGLDAE